jgi:hypothetical protein
MQLNCTNVCYVMLKELTARQHLPKFSSNLPGEVPKLLNHCAARAAQPSHV